MDLNSLDDKKKKDVEDLLQLLRGMAEPEQSPVQTENNEKPHEENSNNSHESFEEGSTDSYESFDDEEEFYEEDSNDSYESVDDDEEEELYEEDISEEEEIHKDFHDIPDFYNTSESDAEPASAEDVNSNFSDTYTDEDKLEALFRGLSSRIPINPNMQKAYQRAAQNPTRNDNVLYKKDSCNIGDNNINFTRAGVAVNWVSEFSDNDRYGNFDILVKNITKDIYVNFGGWERIKTIYVYDNQLIINNVCYMPKLRDSDVSKFPFDTVDYIRNGCIAPLFDWSTLRKMTGLTIIGFDSVDFYTTTVADSIGIGRRIGAVSLFKICDNLDKLCLGNDCITREDLNTPKSKEVKQKVAKSKRFNNLLDGYHLNVYAGTEGIQNFTVNNLKNYASNRGNKGLIRYLGGTVARAGLAAVGLTANLGAHVIGGTFKAIKNVVKDAITSYDNEE